MKHKDYKTSHSILLASVCEPGFATTQDGYHTADSLSIIVIMYSTYFRNKAEIGITKLNTVL
jgi:hypothetical protein